MSASRALCLYIGGHHCFAAGSDISAWFHPNAAGNAAYAAAVLDGLARVVTKIGTVDEPESTPGTEPTSTEPTYPDTTTPEAEPGTEPSPGDEQPSGGDPEYPESP